MSDRGTLIRLLAQRSVRRGRFTLASGRESSHYVDARLTTMSPEGLAIIGPLALAAIREEAWAVDAVGGLTLGADPIAYATAIASVSTPPLVRAFTVRKEAKQHGTGRLVEGPMREGDRVVVIEDVITTGGSALRAAEAVQRAGASISGILALVDREEGGRAALEAQGFQVVCLATLTELLEQSGGAPAQAS
ncbi:MAG TPA: orotate phosphoribosyltransferase [Gemmatimonadaceae bacterium]|nr:orotate phosphoribosyltransferase [Gemmatimonadaceae bacterium]